MLALASGLMDVLEIPKSSVRVEKYSYLTNGKKISDNKVLYKISSSTKVDNIYIYTTKCLLGHIFTNRAYTYKKPLTNR